MPTRLQSLLRSFVVGSSGLFEDANGAIAQFGILWLDVDHQIAIDIAEASHGRGGDHVENHFVCGSGFHA